ncbi:MAG: hypothetical protein ACTSRP_16050, partial [Candidatus Helarchaeota archaeon]
YFISRKIAKLLNLELKELGYNKNFFKYFEKSINYNPMMDVLFCWYYAIYEDLPIFDILLTGYNGDNQFGSHLSKNDLEIRNDNEFAEIIIKKYCELRNINNILNYINDKKFILKLKKNLSNFSKNSKNSEFWQKKEEFNFKYRQRIFIKNNPSFNFFGLYDSLSIFIDPDLMEFLMTIPFKLRLNRKLFYDFLKKKIPILLKIRPEREIAFPYKNNLLSKVFKIIQRIDNKIHLNIIVKKSHKNVHIWLSNNNMFKKYIEELFSKEDSFYFQMFNINLINKLILKKKWNLHEIYLLCRLITIKLFIEFIDKLKC